MYAGDPNSLNWTSDNGVGQEPESDNTVQGHISRYIGARTTPPVALTSGRTMPKRFVQSFIGIKLVEDGLEIRKGNTYQGQGGSRRTTNGS